MLTFSDTFIDILLPAVPQTPVKSAEMLTQCTGVPAAGQARARLRAPVEEVEGPRGLGAGRSGGLL